MKRLSLILIAIFFVGCSSTGPYVTAISSNGRGGLIIEKSKVQYNSFTGTITSKDTSTTEIQVIPESLLEKIEKLTAGK